MHPEDKLRSLGLEIPTIPEPIANYVQWTLIDRTLYLAGAVPRYNGELQFVGKVDADVSVEDGYKAARFCTLNHLAMIKQAVGDLDRVQQIARLVGYVNSSPGFRQQPKVVDGASDLFVEVFGDRGRHARAAFGINEIANNVPVETVVTVGLKA